VASAELDSYFRQGYLFHSGVGMEGTREGDLAQSNGGEIS